MDAWVALCVAYVAYTRLAPPLTARAGVAATMKLTTTKAPALGLVTALIAASGLYLGLFLGKGRLASSPWLDSRGGARSFAYAAQT